eukprot:gene7852-9967_t
MMRGSATSTLPAPPASHRRRHGVYRYKFVRRIVQFKQLDFDMALHQMLWLVIAPKKVYRSVHYHKNTKNQWARDDPAFLVLLAIFLTVSTAVSAIFFQLSFSAFFRLLLWVIFVDCVGVGFIANKFLKAEPMTHHVAESVEFAYAFDIHFITQPWFLSNALANGLWLIAISQYTYITFLGYSALPFLKNTQAFLYPMVPVLVICFLSTLFQWNISVSVLRAYGLNDGLPT